MIVNYDDRVRTPSTQPPGLPRGGLKIFAGYSNWEEVTPEEGESEPDPGLFR